MSNLVLYDFWGERVEGELEGGCAPTGFGPPKYIAMIRMWLVITTWQKLEIKEISVEAIQVIKSELVQSVKTEPVMFRQNELQLCCLAAIVEVFRLIFSYSAAHLQ